MEKTTLNLELKSNSLYINRKYDLNTITAELAITNFLVEIKALQELKERQDPNNEYMDCYYSNGTRLTMIKFTPFDEVPNDLQ